MTNTEQYLNMNKHTCIQLPEHIGEYLQVDKFLSEYEADEEKELVMQNILLLDSFPTEGSTKLVNSGDLFNVISGINDRIDSLNQTKAERQELQNLSQVISQSINNLSEEIDLSIQQSDNNIKDYVDGKINIIQSSIDSISQKIPDNIQQQLDSKLNIDVYNQEKQSFLTINDLGLNVQEHPYTVLPGQIVKQQYKTITISDNKEHSVSFDTITLYKEWLPMNIDVSCESNEFIITNSNRIVNINRIELFRQNDSSKIYVIPTRIIISRNNLELINITDLEEYYNPNYTWKSDKKLYVEDLSNENLGHYTYKVICYYDEDGDEKYISKDVTINIVREVLDTYIYVNEFQDDNVVINSDFLNNSENYITCKLDERYYALDSSTNKEIITLNTSTSNWQNIHRPGFICIIIPEREFDDSYPYTKEIGISVDASGQFISSMVDGRDNGRNLVLNGNNYIWFVTGDATDGDYDTLKFYVKPKNS